MKKNEKKKIKKTELLCPAGDWPSLLTAIDCGADSVYFGVKGLNMREMAHNFEPQELLKVMNTLHAQNRKGYLALNIIVMDHELLKVQDILEQAKEAGIDGVILWDLAVFSLARKLRIPVHVSTQASVSNFEALRFYHGMGARRIVLARECTLEQIRAISQRLKTKKLRCEIEAFVHGAMCLSISGRCFMSLYTHGTSANRGQCYQPCRREYQIIDPQQGEAYVVGKDYVLSPKDLCTIDFIDQMIEAGITSFKIEGRTRSPEYLKVVATVYRQAIDLYFEGRLTLEKKEELRLELSKVYNRGFHGGFYFGEPDAEPSRGLEHQYHKIYLGIVKKIYPKIQVAEILLHNGPLAKGDSIVVFGPQTPTEMIKIDEIQRDHQSIERGEKGELIGLKLPFSVRPKDKIFLWQEKIEK